MKIKDIVNEETRVRDPYEYDYEKDPETGEYTGRTTIDRGPGMFSRMLQKHGSDIPSFVPTDEYQPKDKLKPRTTVPQGKRLVVTTRDQRPYYKYPATAQDRDKSGKWTDAGGRIITDSRSLDALEQLAKQNGKFENLAAQTQPAAADTKPTTEPENIIIPEPSRRRTEPPPEEPTPKEPIPVEPEEPISLVDQPISNKERIAVDTPAGTFYKYSDGNWYQIPTTGTPVRARYEDYAILDDYANKEGYVEQIPTAPKPKGRRR